MQKAEINGSNTGHFTERGQEGSVLDSILEIFAYGAWNGGILLDNAMFENKGMFFKGNIPVTDETIQERVGVRTRKVAPPGEKIAAAATRDLLETSGIDPSRIKLVIAATNLGEDKYDAGPAVRHSLELLQESGNGVLAMDVYAGCPGFNVAVETVFMLSLTGALKKDDISVILGAENPHRTKGFRPMDTSNILFGDDALAAALVTRGNAEPEGRYWSTKSGRIPFTAHFVDDIAEAIAEIQGADPVEGIILDNQLGKLQYKVPATAARAQHRLVEIMHPEATGSTFTGFTKAMDFYSRHVHSFAFDIMTRDRDPSRVREIAKAYVESGKYGVLASAYLDPDSDIEVAVHKGEDFSFQQPRYGIVDTSTRTHGCFADYIQVVPDKGDVFVEIDGKGVFLHATRGAGAFLREFLKRNGLTLDGIDLLIEHQANFAMIPMTLERALGNGNGKAREAAAEYIRKRMVMNIHERGNCSVVSMLRLPYDLERGALKEDNVQGYPVNMELDSRKYAKTILNDSVGSGMTRSAFLQRKR